MQKTNDPDAVAVWKARRQKCRVNLGYLCTEALGYTDVSKAVHGEMIAHMQKFRGGEDGAIEDVVKGKGYTPACSMWELPGPRRRLILVPRGHLKTSICTAAHTIQWIINYPNIRILLSTGTGDQMIKFLSEVKQHFQFNARFRGLFPEFCPPSKNVKDWGTQEQFTVPCRRIETNDRLLREPTVSTCSIDKVSAGGHFDVIKHDDLQDEIAARTPGRIDTVKRHYGEMGPLLETSPIPPHHGWEDIIGTIYDYCLVGESRILMSDWSHKAISDVQVGDEVVGWSLDKRMMLRKSRVLAIGRHKLVPVKKYTLASGKQIVCTPEHRWWRGPKKDKSYSRLGWSRQRGEISRLNRLLIPIERQESWAAGWLAGFFDGEGTVQQNPNPRFPSGCIGICQSMHNPILIDKTRIALRELGFDFRESWHSPSKSGGKPHWKDRCVFIINGGWRERYRFLAMIAPFRHQRISDTLYGMLKTERDNLVSIEDAGLRDVYWFQTETGNYIVEGYCSKNSDLHYSIYESEMAKPPERRVYSILLRSAAPNYPEGPVMWPDRVPLAALKAIEDDPARGPAVLYPQYLMNPIVGKSGLVDSEKDLVWVPPTEMTEQIYPRLSLHLTVDLAGMESASDKRADNDYTVLNLHGFTGGVMYVPHVWHGRYTPEEVINLLFQIARDHPRLQSIKIEKDAHARVLLPFLKREMAKRNKWLPITELKRDNQTSKQQRIRSLQPWLKQKAIRFSADLPCKLQLINEILRFPKYHHDDILDTLADAMQNREGGVTGDVVAPPREFDQQLREHPLALNPDYRQFYGLEEESTNTVDQITGY